MYSEDDAVAKVDGYLIEVTDAIPYVGEKMLVRIEQAGRTSARAVLADVAEEAAAATEERAKARERAAKRAATAARNRRRKKPAPSAPSASEEVAAVEALADDETGVHAGTGPAAVAEADEDAAKPRRRGRGRARSAAEAEPEADTAAPGGHRGLRRRRGIIEASAPRPQRRTAPFACESRWRRRGSLRSQRVI